MIDILSRPAPAAVPEGWHTIGTHEGFARDVLGSHAVALTHDEDGNATSRERADAPVWTWAVDLPESVGGGTVLGHGYHTLAEAVRRAETRQVQSLRSLQT